MPGPPQGRLAIFPGSFDPLTNGHVDIILRSAHLPKEIRERLRSQSEDSLRYSAITIHAVPSRSELAHLLEKYEGNVARVAEHYAKDRRHVYRWLTRHDLSAADFRK